MTLRSKETNVVKYREDEFYMQIKEITFTPTILFRSFKPSVKKGKFWFWRLFGVIPLVPLKAKEDLFEFHIGDFSRFKPWSFIQKFYHDAKIIGYDVYDKPWILIRMKDGSDYRNERWNYETDEETMNVFMAIKDKCAQCNNPLGT